MSEALKEAKDRHVHQLWEAYLITRAKWRTLAAKRQDAPILEGIPIHPPEKKENRCCGAASTSTLRSVRSRALGSSHSAIAPRRYRLVPWDDVPIVVVFFIAVPWYCTLAIVVIHSCWARSTIGECCVMNQSLNAYMLYLFKTVGTCILISSLCLLRSSTLSSLDVLKVF